MTWIETETTFQAWGDDKWVDKILELMETVDDYIPTPERDTDKPFLLAVEDVFSISGRGTVCTGRVEQGIVKKGDEVEILGRGKKPQKSVITGIRMFNTDLPEGPAGYTVGVLCRGIEKDAVFRGQVICAPGATTTHTKFKANIYFAKKDEGGRNNPVMPGYMPVFYFRTCDVTGKIEGMTSSEGSEVQMAMPGDDVTCECELIAATPIEKGMRFAMREDWMACGYCDCPDSYHICIKRQHTYDSQDRLSSKRLVGTKQRQKTTSLAQGGKTIGQGLITETM